MNNLDAETSALIQKLKWARGEAYANTLRAVYARIGARVRADAQELKLAHGKFTPSDIARLCVRYGLAFKPMCETF